MQENTKLTGLETLQKLSANDLEELVLSYKSILTIAKIVLGLIIIFVVFLWAYNTFWAGKYYNYDEYKTIKNTVAAI